VKYLWEVLLKADEQNLPREKLCFTPTKTPSPYMEVALDEVNRQHLDEKPIEINAYYRFSAIFDYLIAGLDEYSEYRECLYDIIVHFLAELNLREGLCRDEFFGIFLSADVKSGKFGKQFVEVFKTFEYKHIRFVVESMVRLYNVGASLTLLRSVLRQIYPRSIIYLDAVKRSELLIYIGKKETPELRRQVEFLLALFAPFDYVRYLFWDMHFGIVGVDETMVLDEFVIY